jgi:hypothetical protein
MLQSANTGRNSVSVTKIDVALHFGELGYIGLPFWPERNTVINIMKDAEPQPQPEPQPQS